MTFSLSQVDFTSCGGFLCIAAVVLMVIGVVTAIVLSFQYVRTCWTETWFSPVVYQWGGRICVTGCMLKGLSYVTQQVPWLHMLYAAIGAVVYTLVSPHRQDNGSSL